MEMGNSHIMIKPAFLLSLHKVILIKARQDFNLPSTYFQSLHSILRTTKTNHP
jgi:hypothetical protein